MPRRRRSACCLRGSLPELRLQGERVCSFRGLRHGGAQATPDAVRDGDRILAVIRGTATNQDGRSETITIPSMDAQVAAYRSALEASGVDAASIGMVEAHGTGTPCR